MTHHDILIVGAGHGGAQVALALRQGDFEGTVALLGDEADPPYERPPLSKDYLAGDKPFERLLIRPRSFWEERDVELLLGRRIVSVDRDARRVSAEPGEDYQHLKTGPNVGRYAAIFGIGDHIEPAIQTAAADRWCGPVLVQ